MSNLFFTPAKAAPYLYELIREVIKEPVNEKQFAYTEIFDVRPMKPEHTSIEQAGMGMPQPRKLIEDLAPVNYEVGEIFRKRPTEYGAQFAIPNELIRDLADVGPYDGDIQTRIGSFADFVREMKFNARRRINAECVVKFKAATSTSSAFTDRYGEALASATHTSLSNPSTSQSNTLPNVALTENTLGNAMMAMTTQQDHRGAMVAPPSGLTLVVGPALAITAWKIRNTPSEVGSANNTKNYIYEHRDKFKIVVWPELGADYLGWALLGDKHTLRVGERQKPEFSKEGHGSTNSTRYFMTQSFAVWHENWWNTIFALPT